jgi:hypothetical protein
MSINPLDFLGEVMSTVILFFNIPFFLSVMMMSGSRKDDAEEEGDTGLITSER